MAKIKKLLALGLCLCMAAGITVGCGDSKSSKSVTDSGKNTNDGLSFAFCTNTLNNTFQSSIDSKLKMCIRDRLSGTRILATPPNYSYIWTLSLIHILRQYENNTRSGCRHKSSQ